MRPVIIKFIRRISEIISIIVIGMMIMTPIVAPISVIASVVIIPSVVIMGFFKTTFRRRDVLYDLCPCRETGRGRSLCSVG